MRDYWRAAIALVILTVVGVKTDSAIGATVAAGSAYLAVSYTALRDELRRRPRKKVWYSHANLVRAFLAANILPAYKKDQPPYVLHYLGKPQTDDSGTTVIIKLPEGMPHTAVTKNHPQLASAFNVPLAKLRTWHEPTSPAGAVHIWIGDKERPLQAKHARSPLATAVKTSWRDPVRIGEGPQGQVIYLGTNECNTLVSGIMGYGKTTLNRLPIGHYLLDPETLIFGCDGKGSRQDYGAVADLAERWVWGTDDEPAEAMLQMFSELLAMVKERNLNSRTESRPPGVLLILEEYQDVRAAAEDDKARKVLDAELGRVIRMGRAVGFHILISTQRPSVEDFPSGQRNLINQRAALVTRNAADAALVLGHTPSLPLPNRKGDAIVALPTHDVQATIDYLSDEDWEALCKRAAKLRAGRPSREPEPPTVEQPADPLLAAVLPLLPASATELLAELPEDAPWRPENTRALGHALRRYPELGVVVGSGRREWRISDPAGVN